MEHKDTPKRFGLEESVIARVLDVFTHYPEVESAILYGSRTMNRYRPGSDIDLTLTGPQLTYRVVNRLENEIDDLLLPYLFDVSILRHIENPDVVDSIRRNGVLFYECCAKGTTSSSPDKP